MVFSLIKVEQECLRYDLRLPVPTQSLKSKNLNFLAYFVSSSCCTSPTEVSYSLTTTASVSPFSAASP